MGRWWSRCRQPSGRRRSGFASTSSLTSLRHARRAAGSSRSDRFRAPAPPASTRDGSAPASTRRRIAVARSGFVDSRAMPAASLVTKFGSTAEVHPGAPDVILASEPTLGATLRTKGRFYFLCEVDARTGAAGAEIAREVADLARQEYYYDLSAGIE